MRNCVCIACYVLMMSNRRGFCFTALQQEGLILSSACIKERKEMTTEIDRESSVLSFEV